MQIMDKENTSLYSIASIWEIAIKLKLGKIGVSRRLDSSFQELLEANGLDSLPITFSHVCPNVKVRQTPSRNISFDAYNVRRIW